MSGAPAPAAAPAGAASAALAPAPAVAPIPAVAAAAPVVVWVKNPTQGNFNPGTKSGKLIFKLKTAGLPDGNHISLDRKNAQ